jgi:hypothetical protein
VPALVDELLALAAERPEIGEPQQFSHFLERKTEITAAANEAQPLKVGARIALTNARKPAIASKPKIGRAAMLAYFIYWPLLEAA